MRERSRTCACARDVPPDGAFRAHVCCVCNDVLVDTFRAVAHSGAYTPSRTLQRHGPVALLVPRRRNQVFENGLSGSSLVQGRKS